MPNTHTPVEVTQADKAEIAALCISYGVRPVPGGLVNELAHRLATRAVDTELLEALKEQVGECFDPLCDMCARHQAIITKAEAGS